MTGSSLAADAGSVGQVRPVCSGKRTQEGGQKVPAHGGHMEGGKREDGGGKREGGRGSKTTERCA